MKALKTRCLAWIWKQLPTCVEMTRLASRSLDESLPWRVRLRMRMHWFVCRWCRRYQTQLRFLRRATHAHAEQITTQFPVALSPKARERIKCTLRNRGS